MTQTQLQFQRIARFFIEINLNLNKIIRMSLSNKTTCHVHPLVLLSVC